jgi:predicted transcriptional regulator of viral defense system
VSAREDLFRAIEADPYDDDVIDAVEAYRVEVLREAVAIAAAEQLVDCTDHPRDEGYNAAIDDVVTALTRAADAG